MQSISFANHPFLSEPFADDFLDQTTLDDDWFRVPLPEADPTTLLADSFSDSPFVPSLMQDLFALHQSDLLSPEPSMIMNSKIMGDVFQVNWPSETRNNSIVHAHTSSVSNTPPSRPVQRFPQAPVVRVQSRQADFHSDKPVEITLELLAEHFHESLEVASAKIGIGKSTMKLVCRQLGVEKWPYKFNRKGGKKVLRRPDGCKHREESSTASDTDGSEEPIFL
ncbi:hypothetical protein GUITHDRAFT_101978 [Guillardia theta CCMP2712]|uniref:RWP-RK domain-containing protein n=2 Tax=Guillardia theta TaxID=55529 RepID=L1JUR8_GUITC|nr:hypothetical protein GUITHDRAFT_101978 [Guillardia theta CCMP2712]EKX52074.1 hypothetical protein GUITHDRAFT_101978 [Guillardia theta CCMP2712]|mmetsp:Transcript_399/g.882  ORF Transcript_399/g.882 Transcript_399/m.882 type:complete len:223 (+) Transcript_399:141-809(+)|eukprot:XP_005839054.1 hypothetical protein GUITHDRAFT_101978 [Guillardia theta CCMP2712]